jgi:hypothetical protein
LSFIPGRAGGVIVTQSIDVTETDKEAESSTKASSPGYSESIFADKRDLEDSPGRRKRAAASTGVFGCSRRRVIVVAAVATLVLLAIIVGLAVGLSRKSSKRYVLHVFAHFS